MKKKKKKKTNPSTGKHTPKVVQHVAACQKHACRVGNVLAFQGATGVPCALWVIQTTLITSWSRPFDNIHGILIWTIHHNMNDNRNRQIHGTAHLQLSSSHTVPTHPHCPHITQPPPPFPFTHTHIYAYTHKHIVHTHTHTHTHTQT